MSVLTDPVVGCIGRENFFLLVRVYASYRNDYRFVAEIALEAKVVRGHLFLQLFYTQEYSDGWSVRLTAGIISSLSRRTVTSFCNKKMPARKEHENRSRDGPDAIQSFSPNRREKK